MQRDRRIAAKETRWTEGGLWRTREAHRGHRSGEMPDRSGFRAKSAQFAHPVHKLRVRAFSSCA